MIKLLRSNYFLFLLILFQINSNKIVNANELLVETFQQLNMRDHAFHQMIIGTVVIAGISVCIIGFIIIFECYHSYCNHKPIQYERSSSQDTYNFDDKSVHERTLSFHDIFRDDIMDAA